MVPRVIVQCYIAILLSILCHFDIFRSIFCVRYFAFDILSVDILRIRYFAVRYFAIRYFAISIFCVFDILRFDILRLRYSAFSIFYDFHILLSIFCVRYFAIRYFAFRYFVRNPCSQIFLTRPKKNSKNERLLFSFLWGRNEIQ